MTETPVKTPNPVKTTATVWWILTVVFAAGIFTPAYVNMAGGNGDGWQFALMVVCFVMALTSFITAIMYTKRARLVSSILHGEHLLCHWTYSREEWDRYSANEHLALTKTNRGLFITVAVIAAIVGIIGTIIKPHDWIVMLISMGGIIVIAGISALLAVTLSDRQNRRYLGEVYIAPKAVYINRVLHTWQGFGARLESVEYNDAEDTPLVQISYSIPSRYSRQTATVRVPVPERKEEDAKRITAELGTSLKKG